MPAKFDGGPARRVERLNLHPAYDPDRMVYVTPCVRCGVPGMAEACQDCRTVDRANFGSCMSARRWQKHLSEQARWMASRHPSARDTGYDTRDRHGRAS